MLFQSGLPILYAGDEIAQENDYTYHLDPEKADDSRYIHRGNFDWEKVKRRKVKGTVEQRIFDGLKQLEAIRREIPAFDGNADVWTIETWNDSILAIGRYYNGSCVIGLFNFCGSYATAWVDEAGNWRDRLTGNELQMRAVTLPPYGVMLCENIP